MAGGQGVAGGAGGKRGRIALGMAAGGLWAAALLIGGAALWPVAGDPLALLAWWMLAPGLTLLVMIGNMARTRFFDDAIIDGEAPAAGSGAEINLRVLTNTAEQALLAMMIWSALAMRLPEDRLGAIPALACGFVIARAAFWIGYHVSPTARAFGFAASFYPTVLAALWALWLTFAP